MEQPAFALVNETTGRTLARNLSVSTSLMSRFKGLMGQTNFSDDSAMGLSRCNWVHTFLVKFPIDLVYCDGAGKALAIVADLKPNRFAARAPGAFWAYEMKRGRLAPFVSPGDCLSAAVHPALAAKTPGEE